MCFSESGCDFDIVSMLVKYKADINIRNKQNELAHTLTDDREIKSLLRPKSEQAQPAPSEAKSGAWKCYDGHMTSTPEYQLWPLATVDGVPVGINEKSAKEVHLPCPRALLYSSLLLL